MFPSRNSTAGSSIVSIWEIQERIGDGSLEVIFVR
jgi:hypothetical protein